MKKAKLPLPLLILILAIFFALASTLGEWIGSPASASRTHPSDTVERSRSPVGVGSVCLEKLGYGPPTRSYWGHRGICSKSYSKPIEM